MVGAGAPVADNGEPGANGRAIVVEDAVDVDGAVETTAGALVDAAPPACAKDAVPGAGVVAIPAGAVVVAAVGCVGALVDSANPAVVALVTAC
jgi:hypothetical protein